MKLRILSHFSSALVAVLMFLSLPQGQAQTHTVSGSNPMPILTFGGRILFIDIDSDGDADLLSQNGNTPGTGIELRINNGNGTFAAPIAAAAPSGTFGSGPLNGITFSAVITNSSPSLFAVDVDDDGHMDIVESTNAVAGRWIRNNGNGTFTSQASPFPTLTFGARIFFGDWNGDGAVDVLYQNGSTNGTGIAMMLNNGDGTFATPIAAAAGTGTFSSGPFNGISFTAITIFNTYSLFLVDYDKDGDRDLVEQVNSTTGTGRVIRNNGGGSWSVTTTPFPSMPFGARIFFGDFESDGDLDILYQIGNAAGAGWNVQLNNGDGTYAAAITAPATGTFASGPFSGHTFTQLVTSQFVSVDIDKDGDHDVVEQVNSAPILRQQNGSPPVLASSIPADNATGVAVGSNITLNFDRSVSKGTGNIIIRRTNVGNTLFESIPVTSGLVTGSGTTWVVNPTNNLADTTAYSITIDAGTFVDGTGKAFHELSGKLTLNFVSGVAVVPTTVTSLNRVNPATTNLGTVNWTLTFAAANTGVVASNFNLSGAAAAGSAVGAPTTGNGGLTWNVPVTTGGTDGALTLNLTNSIGTTPGVSTALPFVGQSYTIDKTAPTIGIGAPSASSIAAGAGSITYTVTYADTNFNSSTLSTGDITLNSTGGASGTIGVSGSGSTRTVTVSSITGVGTLGISIAAGTASDTAGNTAPSAGPSATFSVLSPPGAPTIGTATAGNASASVTFTAPASNGGSPITSYTVTSSPGGITGAGATSPIVVSGLTNGTPYTFTVTATNGVGTGAASTASAAVTPATVPGAPTSPVATRGDMSASVAFSAPASNGGSAITSYTVTSSPGGITGTGAASPIVVSGLTNGTPYTFTVTATNGVGTGAASPVSNSVTPATVPTVTSPTSTGITLTTATLGGNVVSDGGAAISQRGIVYALTATNSSPQIGGVGVAQVTAAGTTGAFTTNVSILSSASAYSFRAYAINSAGTSYTSTSTFTTLTAIQSWRLTHFGSIVNSGNGADGFDFDNDGLANVVEFAFGLTPTSGASLQLPQPVQVGSDFVFTFTQPGGVSGITYGAEWSTTLLPGSWTPITDTGSGGTHTFSVPIGTNDRMFMRFVVTAP